MMGRCDSREPAAFLGERITAASLNQFYQRDGTLSLSLFPPLLPLCLPPSLFLSYPFFFLPSPPSLILSLFVSLSLSFASLNSLAEFAASWIDRLPPSRTPDERGNIARTFGATHPRAEHDARSQAAQTGGNF